MVSGSLKLTCNLLTKHPAFKCRRFKLKNRVILHHSSWLLEYGTLTKEKAPKISIKLISIYLVSIDVIIDLSGEHHAP